MEEKNWQLAEKVIDIPERHYNSNIIFIAEVICGADRESDDAFGFYDCSDIL